jgi:TonB-linked SusC/RagA family outer membrane protein
MNKKPSGQKASINVKHFEFMKKTDCIPFQVGFKKILRIMRITAFIVFILSMQVYAKSFGQTEKVNLSMNSTFKEVIERLEEISGYRFVLKYNESILDKKVEVKYSNESIEKVLDDLLKNTGFTYSIVDRYIAIRPLGEISVINQQQKSIKGKVTDSTGASLPGVSVVVKGTTIGTITDVDGNYILNNLSENTTLQFSFVGMKLTEVVVGNKSTLNVTMAEETIGLDEVVAVGYGTQRKADLTGAIGTVKTENMKEVPTGNIMKALQGHVAGVYIRTDGSPGANATVRIRGGSTMSGGFNDPLYIIDGIPTTTGIEQLNSNDIESMQVLKDASAASIYGSRANNGVILITTKKGKSGNNKVEFSSYFTLQNYADKLDVLNTWQRGYVNWQASINDGRTPTSSIYSYNWHTDASGKATLDKILLPEYIDPSQTMKPADTRWFDEVSRLGIIQSQNLTFTNGSEKGTMLLSLNYFDNNGIIKQTDFSRYTARINSDYNFIKGKLKVGENLAISKINNNEIPTGDVMYLALVQQPVVPVHSIDGGWGGPAPGMTDRHNPVRLIDDNKQNVSKSARVFGNLYADLQIIKNLNFRSNFGIDYTEKFLRKMDYSYVSGFLISDITRNTTSQEHHFTWTWSNTLNYKFEKGQHHADFLLGTEAIKYEDSWFWASREGFVIQDTDYMYLDAGTTNFQNGGGGAANSLLSYFGKINYSFKDRYLFSGTIRRDGSSRFGKDNQFGIFPAFSLGWRVSEEGFLKNNLSIISNLKFRAGWGKTGNQEISNQAIYSLYKADIGIDPTWTFDSGTAYDIKGIDTGALPSGFRKTNEGNPILKWEEAQQTNVGLDFGFINQKITGSIDYFTKETKDILLEPPYLAAQGEGGNQWVNGASLKVNGLEFVLGYSNKFENGIELSVTGNISSYKRKVTSLPSSVLTGYPGDPAHGKSILGRSDLAEFGYIADGIFQNQAEVDAYANQPGKGVGRIRFKDIGGLDANGNYVDKPDGVVNDLDRTFLGDPNPKFEYGFDLSISYKGFDLAAFFQGISGAKVYNQYKNLTDFTSIWPGTNFGTRTLDAWSPTNTGSTIPMLTLTDTNNEGRYSSYFIENGSYLKLRNLQLGYTIPKNKLDFLKISKARIYIQGQNLLTVKDNKGSDKYTGVDPENPNFAYPIARSFTLGLNVTF